MDEQKSLEELLILVSQQGVTIAEQQKQISDLQSELQEKDSQLSEALRIAEEMKAQASEVSTLLRENQLLQQQLRECDLRAEVALEDARKEYSLREQMLMQKIQELQNSREKGEGFLKKGRKTGWQS